MSRPAANQGRMLLPEPERSAAPSCAVLRVPGIGGLRLLHATHGDHLRPVGNRSGHRHDLWHCVVYAEGRGSCLLDGAEVAVQAPFLVLTSPGQEHCFSRRAGEDTVYHEATFAPERPGATSDWAGLLGAWTGIPCPVPDRGACSTACAADLAAVIARLCSAIRDPHPAAAVLLQGQLAELLFTLFRHLVVDTAPAAPPDPLEAARRFIETQAEDPINLAAVARVAGLSPKHLGRAFAARFGQPPMRWRRQVLMRRAAVLLRTCDAPVERIAAQLGFADWRYFSRCFAAVNGCGPAAFRRGM